ncbi:hypothetical protein EB118_13365 [bacterium]|nr:hypothetical protein [bacterium]NDD83758.1 hypothetical protein [bacterium]NDG31041.1 hypothetical protein [bacterium]
MDSGLLYVALAIIFYCLFITKRQENFENPQNILLDSFYKDRIDDPRFKSKFKNFQEFKDWFNIYDSNAYKESEKVRADLLFWENTYRRLRTEINNVTSVPVPAMST